MYFNHIKTGNAIIAKLLNWYKLILPFVRYKKGHMKKEDVIQLIKDRGHEDATYCGIWKGYQVFLPEIIKGGGILGRPYLILEKNGRLKTELRESVIFEICEDLNID